MDANSDMKNETEYKDSHPFFYAARRILLAGIGVIALTHDEVEEFVDKLVERGEIAKKDGESLLSEVKERRKKYLHNDDNYFHKRMEDLFDRFHVPAKKDFDEIVEKITALEKKIDDLNKSKE
jgi:polyhydroxyalkanoate synthesis regulator phasin